MEIAIISLENRKGARLGETLRVRRGYARYLIAQNKAVPDNADNREKFASMRAELEQKEAEALEKAEARATQLKALNLKISSRTADERRLYGSLGPRELAIAITEAGVPVEKQAIQLPTGPIRQVGEYTIGVRLHNKITVSIPLQVVAAN